MPGVSVFYLKALPGNSNGQPELKATALRGLMTSFFESRQEIWFLQDGGRGMSYSFFIRAARDLTDDRK